MVALNTTLQSVKAYQTGGVPPSILAYCMEHSKYLDQYQDLLHTYFLNYWSGKYILKEMKEGCIMKNGIKYHVVFDPSISRGFIQRHDSLAQYKLSFRSAHEYYQLPAFVYISQ